MDIYYPKDNAVSHGKVHELLGPEALQKGEPLTEESIRWLLELHGEMYLIEQHYSTRTRTRRLALNGTPVAEFSDVEPMVDFQLGAANIRMCFTVRDNGIVYELFVNGKRFEDLTQALPSPIAARAEGSGMTFGARLMSQRLGLLPPHLQVPPPQPQPAPALPSPHLSADPQYQQLMALPPLDSSLSSLTQPIPLDNALALLDDSLGHGPGHHRRASRRISLSLGGHHAGGAHDPTDILASIAAASALHPAIHAAAASQALALTTATATATTTSTAQHHQHHPHGFMSTPETTAAAGTPTTIALSSASHTAGGSSAWADMVVMDGPGASPSFVMMLPADATATVATADAPARMMREETTAMVIGAGADNVHGAGLLLRPSVEELYFSSDDEGEGGALAAARAASAMVLAAPAAVGGGGGGGRAARRRRGTTSEFLIQDGEEEGEGEGTQGDAMMDTVGGGPGRIMLPAFKVAKTSAAARPATGPGAMVHHGSLPNLLTAAAAQQQQQQQQQSQVEQQHYHPHHHHQQQQKQQQQKQQQKHHVAPHPLKRRGLEHVLAEGEGGGARPPAIQRSLSASDVMGRPPKLSIQVPAPPTTLNCTGLLKRGLLKSGAGTASGGGGGGGNVGPRGVQPPVCLPR